MIAAFAVIAALTVSLVGDSLSVRTAPMTQQAMPNHRIYVDAVGGMPTTWGIRRLEARKAQGQLGDTVVFALGTNDDPSYPGSFEQRLVRVRQIIGKRCLVMPSMWVRGSVTPFNRIIPRYADVRVPWVTAVRTGRIKLYDGIHPGWSTERERARMVADAIRRCEAR